MRCQASEHSLVVWISADETCRWAHRHVASWPCSTLSGHRLRLEFDSRDDLVDFAVDGRSDLDVDGHELEALLTDFLGPHLGRQHRAYLARRQDAAQVQIVNVDLS